MTRHPSLSPLPYPAGPYPARITPHPQPDDKMASQMDSAMPKACPQGEVPWEISVSWRVLVLPATMYMITSAEDTVSPTGRNGTTNQQVQKPVTRQRLRSACECQAALGQNHKETPSDHISSPLVHSFPPAQDLESIDPSWCIVEGDPSGCDQGFLQATQC